MSSEFLHTIPDDSDLEKQLQKQIGCMTGILQLFDRPSILTGKRLYGHKKLPAARSSTGCGSPRSDDNIASVQNVAEDDNHRSSVDSGASSIQISRAASVHLDNNVRLKTSFPESKQMEKFEASAKSSWDHRPGRSTSTRNSPRLSVDDRGDASILSKEISRPSLDSRQTGRLSLDIRDVVRDSFYRDSPKLSLETKFDEKSQSRDGHKYVLKPMDSPRPPIDARDTSKLKQQLSTSPSSRKGQKPKQQFQASSDINVNSRKPVSHSSLDVTKKSTTPLDLNESLKVLVKLREAPWNFSENKEPPRPSFELKEGPRSSFSKDSPRFSYDGRDIPRSASLKLREAPRLSLDSREIARNFELKSNYFGMDTPKVMHKHSHSNGDLTEMEYQSSERKRSPSVVARLMGLEELPGNSNPTSEKTGALYLSQSEEKSGLRISPEARKSLQYCKAMESIKQATEKENSLLDSSKKHQFQTQCSDERSDPVEETNERVLGSPRSIQSWKSPWLKHLDAIPKPILMQRCPMEPAPWRQQNDSHSYQRKAFESQNFSDVPKNNERSSQVLYSEIEKRLKRLEHEHCGKDLKTLKQILEAMHNKGLLDSTKEKFNHHGNEFDYTPSSRISPEGKTVCRAREMQDNQLRFGSTNSAKAFQAPIVIMKPAKSVNNSSNSSVVPLEGFPNNQRKVSSVPQPGSSSTKRSTMGNSRALKDQQSGRPNSKGFANHYNNESIAVQNHRRENNIRTKSIENSNDVLQKGIPRPLSPVSSPSTRNQQSSKEILNSVKNSHPSCSTAKIQRKKPEIDRKSRQSGSLKSPRQVTKQIGSETESRSPRIRIRAKGGHLMQIDTMSENSRDAVAAQCPETPRADEISVRSDSNISSISQMDYEVTSKMSDVSADYDCGFDNGNHGLLQSNGSVDSHPKLRRTLEFRTKPKTSGTKTKNEVPADLVKSKDEEVHSEIYESHSEMDEIHLNRCEELSPTSTAPEVSEQPSPISVLDASLFYKDDSFVSPIKKCSIIFKDHEIRKEYDNPGCAYPWNSFAYGTPDDPAVNNKILKNVHSLVRKLDDLNSSSTEKNTFHLHLKLTESLEDQTPEYKYVKEILLASGILFIDTDSISTDSFHASGFPINPELFHVLEQRRASQYRISAEYIQEKHNRHLMFDTVNEILMKKLYPYLHPQPWIRKKDSPSMAAAIRRPSGQHLLKLVWEELQSLQASCNSNASVEDFSSDDAERWKDYRTEMGELVLDVERKIFKDLIDETLGVLCHKDHSTRRQLLFH